MGNFALSFLVFDETGSTFASALVIAIQLIPNFFNPTVGCSLDGPLSQKTISLYLEISSMGNLLCSYGNLFAVFRLFIRWLSWIFFASCYTGSLDELAYNSIFPKIIPSGMEQKGYAISSMLYPLLRVIMLPLAAVLMDTIGMPWLFIGQGLFSICAALIENTIQLTEETRVCEKTFSFQVWKEDLQEVLRYFKKERGLQAIYYYMAATNGVASGYAPILVAFFRTAPGMSAALYSLFSIAEFLGRTIGGVVQYRIEIPKKKKFYVTFAVYTFLRMHGSYSALASISSYARKPCLCRFSEQTAPPYVLPPSSLTFRNPCAPESMHLKI